MIKALNIPHETNQIHKYFSYTVQYQHVIFLENYTVIIEFNPVWT